MDMICVTIYPYNLDIMFIITALDLGKLGTGFGLVCLPKMPELKDKKPKNFTGYDVDLKTIAYK